MLLEVQPLHLATLQKLNAYIFHKQDQVDGHHGRQWC